MRKLFAIFISVSLTFSSCTDDSKGDVSSDNRRFAPAKGGKVFGGTLNISQSENLTNLFPPGIVDVYTETVASHVFESLVKFDAKTLEIKSAVAEYWDVSSDGLLYTFRLKKGIKFHDDAVFGGEGRELLAKDVLYSFELACTQHEQNIMFTSTLKDRLQGANEFYEASASGTDEGERLTGVKVIDD